MATWVDITKLREVCDPYLSNLWGVGFITQEAISTAVSEGRLNGTPFKSLFFDGWTFQQHVERVAYLVVHPSDAPIEVDVGIPSLGCHVDWPVTDGNHRLAAAIYRGDEKIRAEVGGALSEVKKFRFHAPPRSRDSRRQL